jgi:hypothetical protein
MLAHGIAAGSADGIDNLRQVRPGDVAQTTVAGIVHNLYAVAIRVTPEGASDNRRDNQRAGLLIASRISSPSSPAGTVTGRASSGCIVTGVFSVLVASMMSSLTPESPAGSGLVD